MANDMEAPSLQVRQRPFRDRVAHVRWTLSTLGATCRDPKIREQIEATERAANRLGNYWLYPSRTKAAELCELCSSLFDAIQLWDDDRDLFVANNNEHLDLRRFIGEVSALAAAVDACKRTRGWTPWSDRLLM